MSTLTKNQVKTFRKDYVNEEGKPETIIAEVRHDHRCGNGHNTFSITGEVYTTETRAPETIRHESGRKLYLDSCGCIHEQIEKHFPDLAPFIKWHLCSTDGPMHYIANTLYHASDRDCHGLRKGEFRQFRDKQSGLPQWQLKVSYEDSHRTVARAEKPGPVTFDWEPYGREGEGKDRDLNAARSSAVWPEATDEELMSDDLEQRLKDRLPALLDEFRAAVESLGFTY